MVALDADTGKLKWYHQEVPKDVWDFDSAYECVLIDREVRGQMRKLLVHINKGGYAFVLDRVTGEYINGYPIVDNHTWTTGLTEDGKFVGRVEPVEGKPTLILPQRRWAAKAGMRWRIRRAPAFSTRQHRSLRRRDRSQQEPHEGRSFIGGTWKFTNPPDGPAHSHLDAYDPVTGKRQWSYPYKYMLLASLLATAGDLVFTGDPEGFFFALDARTGTKLWSFQTGSGPSRIGRHLQGERTPVRRDADRAGDRSPRGAFPDLWPETATFRGGSTLMVFALPEGTR